MKLLEIGGTAWYQQIVDSPPDLDQAGEPAWSTTVCDREPYPIAQASRKDRLAALKRLPALIQALHQEATQAIKIIEEAKSLIVC